MVSAGSQIGRVLHGGPGTRQIRCPSVVTTPQPLFCPQPTHSLGCVHGRAQVPLSSSTCPLGQQVAPEGQTHVPLWQTFPGPPHGLPSGALTVVQVVPLQTASRQGSAGGGQPTHVPAPSQVPQGTVPQVVPAATGEYVQVPPLHMAPTAVRQTGGVVQMVVPPTQLPLEQVLPVVQASPSSQAAPSFPASVMQTLPRQVVCLQG